MQRFRAGACLDLGAFDPTADDCGVGAFVARSQGSVDWVVIMEDREPTFFHDHDGFVADAAVPLNRHGPRADEWRHADLARLVASFHDHKVKVLLGYWLHESPFVDEDHPELLIRDATGKLWQGHADFSPLRRMRGDERRGIQDGERYARWAGRRYAQLAKDFGFDGLFLGDGGMGFRRHGHDWKDLRHFDYHEAWLAEFASDHAFDHHEDCALLREAPTPEQAADVQAHHWEHWLTFNAARWTDYYRTMAEAVHATGGILAAYNCMNYDPALARLHGVDHRAIAEAGLDLLIFQAYDYAWGPLGPFGYVGITHKDVEMNLQSLLRTRADVGRETKMQIIVTVETEDEVEHWNAPMAHTLGELYHYGGGIHHDGTAWRRAADGAFIVWGNSVPEDEWRALAAAFETLSAPPPTPRETFTWAPEERATIEQETAARYAHLAKTAGRNAIRSLRVPTVPTPRPPRKRGAGGPGDAGSSR